jgi:2-C-methyl-D-erythritol 2,4-cyclodiphosphate synthase
MLLGGVRITSSRGFLGHSDGDVLLHALADALLGAAGLGDIGEHFPDTDARWRGASSRRLLEHLMKIVADRGFSVVNADMTIVTEEPKLHPYKERIRRSVAELIQVATDRINVKAKTKEGLDAVGEGLAAEAHVVVMIARDKS